MTKKKTDKLTPKQEKFAQNVAKGMSKTQAAMDAGYSAKNAQKAGTALASDQNPKIKDRIQTLQTRAANLVSVNLGTHLNDLKDIRDGAVGAGTINKVEMMTKEEILVRMNELYYESGGVLPKGEIIDVRVEDYE